MSVVEIVEIGGGWMSTGEGIVVEPSTEGSGLKDVDGVGANMEVSF